MINESASGKDESDLKEYPTRASEREDEKCKYTSVISLVIYNARINILLFT